MTRSDFVHQYADLIAYLTGFGSVEILTAETEYKGLAIDELPMDLEDLDPDFDERVDESDDELNPDFDQTLNEPAGELIFRAEAITDEQLRIIRRYGFKLKRTDTEPGFILGMFELPEK